MNTPPPLLRLPPPGLVCLVLAAGRGLRMGSPKALMRLGEADPWWMVQQARLNRAGIESLWVVSQAVQDSIMLYRDPVRMLVADGGSEQPMFHSVRAGCAALSQEPSAENPPWIGVLPVDVPVPGVATWERLAGRMVHARDEIARGERGTGVLVPEYRGKTGHPVMLAPGFVAERVLAGPGAREGARLDDLIADEMVRVAVDDAGVRCNINTPDDLRAFMTMNPGWL